MEGSRLPFTKITSAFHYLGRRFRGLNFLTYLYLSCDSILFYNVLPISSKPQQKINSLLRTPNDFLAMRCLDLTSITMPCQQLRYSNVVQHIKNLNSMCLQIHSLSLFTAFCYFTMSPVRHFVLQT